MVAKYKPSEKICAQIRESFRYHKPSVGQVLRYQSLRDEAGKLAKLWAELCPESRELSAALTLLQQANMMANAAIACNEVEAAE